MDTSSFQQVCELLKDKVERGGSIARACRVVEENLISNKDNLRGFFEFCFPLLLKRIFGYDDKEASWLYTVATESRSEDYDALIQLLAPNGPLFCALHAADGDQIIQFLFPPERLPAHTQELLRVTAGRAELDGWPQYRGHLKMDAAGRCQVHLNMFEYFMFWAAFYVLRGARSADKGKGPGAGRGRVLLTQGARKLWGGGGGGNGGGSGGGGYINLFSEPISSPRHPYFKLLRLYLEAYLPRPGGGLARLAAAGGGGGPGGGGGTRRSSSMTGSGTGGGGAGGGGLLGGGGGGSGLGLGGLLGGGAPGGASSSGFGPLSPGMAGGLLSAGPGEVLLSVLLEFWLTDAAEPLPAELPAAAAPGSSPRGAMLGGGAQGAWGAGAQGGGFATAGAAGDSAGLSAAAAGAGGGGLWGMLGLGGAAAAGAAGGGGGSSGDGFGALDASQAALLGYGAAGAAAGGAGGAAAGVGLSAGMPAATYDALVGAGVLPADRLALSRVGGGGAGGLAAAAGGSSLQMSSYQPPSEDLVQALTLLVKYVVVREPTSPDADPQPAQAGRAWLPLSPVATLPLPAGRLALPHHSSPLMASPAFSPAVQAVSRKLYRLLRRTFTQWQPSSSASLNRIITLWGVMLTPWRAASYGDSAALLQTLSVLQAGGGGVGRAASGSGQGGPGGSSSGGAAAGGGGGMRRGGSGLMGGVGGGGIGGGDGRSSGLFGSGVVGQQLAGTVSTLNRWGSEVVHAAHQLSHHGDGGLQRDQRSGGGQQPVCQYSAAWRGHVWAHLPFYTILLPAFLELAYSQMAYSSKAALNNVYRVLKSLAEAGDELIEELRLAEEAYSQACGAVPSSSVRRSEGELADVLPWLVDQAADWEAAAAAGAASQPPLIPDARYRLFNLDHGGAASCMRALLAAADRQNISGRDKLRAAAERVLPLAELPNEELAVTAAHVAGRDLPKAGDWRQLRYQGDWMLRPIASNEVGLLVRATVAVSAAVNRALGLTGQPAPPTDEPPETVVQEVLSVARRRGWRLNLRPLAEVQTLAWLVGLVLITRWLWALVSSEGGLFRLDDEFYAQEAAWAAAQQAAAAQAAAAAAQQQYEHWQQDAQL